MSMNTQHRHTIFIACALTLALAAGISLATGGGAAVILEPLK